MKNSGTILQNLKDGAEDVIVKPFKSEVDTPLTYADYYFIEALMRWKTVK